MQTSKLGGFSYWLSLNPPVPGTVNITFSDSSYVNALYKVMIITPCLIISRDTLTLHRFGDDACDSTNDSLQRQKLFLSFTRSHLMIVIMSIAQTFVCKPNKSLHLQQSFSSFGQTLSKVSGWPVHLLSSFLLVLFIHGDSCQTFTH